MYMVLYCQEKYDHCLLITWWVRASEKKVFKSALEPTVFTALYLSVICFPWRKEAPKT